MNKLVDLIIGGADIDALRKVYPEYENFEFFVALLHRIFLRGRTDILIHFANSCKTDAMKASMLGLPILTLCDRGDFQEMRNLCSLLSYNPRQGGRNRRYEFLKASIDKLLAKNEIGRAIEFAKFEQDYPTDYSPESLSFRTKLLRRVIEKCLSNRQDQAARDAVGACEREEGRAILVKFMERGIKKREGSFTSYDELVETIDYYNNERTLELIIVPGGIERLLMIDLVRECDIEEDQVQSFYESILEDLIQEEKLETAKALAALLKKGPYKDSIDWEDEDFSQLR